MSLSHILPHMLKRRDRVVHVPLRGGLSLLWDPARARFSAARVDQAVGDTEIVVIERDLQRAGAQIGPVVYRRSPHRRKLAAEWCIADWQILKIGEEVLSQQPSGVGLTGGDASVTTQEDDS